MTSKPLISSSPQSAILAGNAATKSSSANGNSVGSHQFDDEFHSALQQHSSTTKTDSSKATSAPANATKPALTTTKFAHAVQQNGTAAGKPNATAVAAAKPSTANDDTAQTALSAALAKDASAGTQTGATNGTLSLDGANVFAKDKKAKKLDLDTSAAAANSSTAVSLLGTALTPDATSSVIPGDANASEKNSDNSQSGQASPSLLTVAVPVADQNISIATIPSNNSVSNYPSASAGNGSEASLLPPPSVAATVTAPSTPVTSAAGNSSSAPAGKETEAFSMLLTPKTGTAPQQSPTQNSNQSSSQSTARNAAAGVPSNGIAAVNQPVTSAKEATTNVSVADQNPAAPAPAARESATSSATNSGSATPSSLEQGSGTTARDAKAEDKEQTVASTASASDSAGNPQGFGGFGGTPDSFVRETKPSGNAAPSAPATTHSAEAQDGLAAAPGSAKEVAIRLEGQAGQTINVKLVDQGGQVQVSVRSNDPAAATALRGDLSSLASNLDKAGWKPEITAVAGGSSLEPVSQTRQPDRSGQDSQGNKQPDWQQQDTPRKRQSVSDVWDELLTSQTT